ncbi:MAG: L-histidine N(alpha)-methyltransferase [Solirubrobacteraceae bacterium]
MGLADDVLDGLTRPFKELPPKHLYDARGSELFEAICSLPEYYPTRTERALLVEHADTIVGDAAELVELGAGSAAKTRVLLDTGRVRRFVPFDVSPTALDETLAAEYPQLEVLPVTGDFEADLDRIPGGRAGFPRLVAFLGGTIGNFLPGARRGFLRGLAGTLGPDGRLLLGAGLITDVDVMEPAYDDAAGVTAAFNLNVLSVVNAELGADFDLSLFEHVAFFDPVNEWIEMRLRVRRAHTVRIAALDLDVAFERGEELRTEISTKFTRERLEADFASAGLVLDAWYEDADARFALAVARVG